MSNTIRTFNSLPSSLQGLAIELAVIRARQDQHANLLNIVEEAVVAAGAALKVGVNTDPAKPGEDQTAYQQAEPAGDSNPDYKDPEIFDPKTQDDNVDALSYLLASLRKAVTPKEHCGNPQCNACNTEFGELDSKEETNKLRFVQVIHQNGVFGPVDIYHSRTTPQVYAIMHKGRTAVIQTDNITEMPYQVAVEIVRLHGKDDRSIVG